MTDLNRRIFERALSLNTKPTGRFQRQVAESLFRTMLRACEDVRANRIDAPLYAFPAPTGSGKSTTAATLITAMTEADPAYSAIIACFTIDEADATYRRLLAAGVPVDELYVYTFEHSDRDAQGHQSRHLGRLAPASHSGLRKARIGVCTHELLMRECKGELDLGVRMHAGIQPRTNIFIDEYPAIVGTFTMVPSDLAFLGEQLCRLDGWDSTHATFKAIEARVQAKFEATGGRAEKVQLLSREEYQVLCSLDRAGLGATSTTKRLDEVLAFLDAASSGNCFLYRGSGVRTAQVRQARKFQAFHRTFAITPGMIILDATFDVSPMRKLFGNVDVVATPTADYRNLRITHIDSPQMFADIARNNTPRSVDEEYLSYVRRTVLENTQPGDRALVIVQLRHQKQQEGVGDWKGRQVMLAHWGAGIGSNDWRECTHVFAFSEFHTPCSVHIAEAFGLQNGPMCPQQLHKETAGASRKGNVALASDGHRLRWLKQMTCRGSVRQIDDEGVCGEMHLFTTMNKELLLTHYQTLFPGTAQPSFIKHPDAKPKSHGERLVDYLMASNDEKLCATQIAAALGIEVKKVATAFNSRRGACLRYRGWEFMPGNGKASTPYLIKTPIVINIPGGPCLTI